MTNPDFWRDLLASSGMPLLLVLIMMALRKAMGLPANAGTDSILWLLGVDSFFIVRPEVVKANTKLAWIAADPAPWSMIAFGAGFLALILCVFLESCILAIENSEDAETRGWHRSLLVPVLVVTSYAPLLVLATAHMYVFATR